MISLCLLNYRYDSLSHFPTYGQKNYNKYLTFQLSSEKSWHVAIF